VPAKAYPLGEWIPDNPGGLQIARNVRAIANGYAPVKAPQSATAPLGSPTFPFRGGGAFIDSTGVSTLLGARTDVVAKYAGGTWGPFGTGGAQQIRFAQFGDSVLIANGAAMQRFQLLSATIGSITDAPAAIDVAQTRDFVMAITTDNALQWCQFNNSSVWTTGTNQADKQPSLWGQLRRIVGGEYMIAITDRAVVRGTYVGVEGGLDIIWQFDEISAEVGCMASGSVCNVGRLIFFLSERGFMMCDGNEVTPIADEKFNRWFFDTYSRAEISGIWAAIDPRYSLAIWAMPGTPGRLIAYNWVLKRATTIEIDVQGIFTGYTAGISLDSLDAIYGNLDAIPISLDDPTLAGGNPILLVADSGNVLNALTGNNLEALFRVEEIEPTPGRRSRIRTIRPLTDATSATATIDARLRIGDTEGVRSASTMRSNGKLPIRSNGRYNTLELTIPASHDWSFIEGFELEWEAGDSR
jgi:hypothetical protein